MKSLNTSYDGTAGYMVDNPIDRYLINSTTEGLILDDGRLTITMQRDEPTDPTERANWLPTPEGRFYLALRMYRPKPEALDGTWNPPPVVRIDRAFQPTDVAGTTPVPREAYELQINVPRAALQTAWISHSPPVTTQPSSRTRPTTESSTMNSGVISASLPDGIRYGSHRLTCRGDE